MNPCRSIACLILTIALASGAVAHQEPVAFVGVKYKNAEGKRDFASLSLVQMDIQEVLDALEAATGIKIQKVLD